MIAVDLLGRRGTRRLRLLLGRLGQTNTYYYVLAMQA